MSTRLPQSFLNIYKSPTVTAELKPGAAKHLLAFDSLWSGLVIVTSNVYSVFVLTVLL